MIAGGGEGKGKGKGEKNKAVPRFCFFPFPRVLKTSVFRMNQLKVPSNNKKTRDNQTMNDGKIVKKKTITIQQPRVFFIRFLFFFVRRLEGLTKVNSWALIRRR